ncbi:biotin carboxylase N-terminal domain-containing protein, partial [Planctomycetota bacterium]
MRVIRAVRELNEEHGVDLRTIALFTDPDRTSSFVREADHAIPLGPATYEDSPGQLRSTYLDYDRLKEAMVSSRADAAWVGWGFVAEDAAFAEICGRLGVTFVGPPPDVMRSLGDKIEAKRLARSVDFPIVPWS